MRQAALGEQHAGLGGLAVMRTATAVPSGLTSKGMSASCSVAPMEDDVAPVEPGIERFGGWAG